MITFYAVGSNEIQEVYTSLPDMIVYKNLIGNVDKWVIIYTYEFRDTFNYATKREVITHGDIDDKVKELESLIIEGE